MSDLFTRVKEIPTPDVARVLLPALELKRDGNGREKALCPFHAEDTPSLTVFKDGFKCFGCGAHGSNVDLLLKAGLASKPLEAARMIAESFDIEFEQERPRKEKPLTLSEYAAYVKLYQDFLVKTFHIRETPGGLEMPYLNEAREEVATRLRTKLKAKEGSRWPKGTVPTLYGLWGLERMKKAGNVLLVEGESDTQVCWFNQSPALGIPGAQTFKREWASLLLPFSLIAIIQEPGEAGERFVKSICAALKEASYQGQVKAVTLSEKDPRDLWLKHQERFKKELQAAITRAPVVDLASVDAENKAAPARDPKSERQEPVAVIEEIEEEEPLAANNLVPFPEAASTGLFGQWRDTVAPCTEAPLENLWGAFLVAAGLMLGRNVWKESPRRLYPNFYLLLLGQTGDSRKSTVLWLAGELLKHVGEEVEILTGIVSTEGLFERLAKAEETRALGYVDELRSLLSVARRKGTQDLLPKLNSLYSCPDKETIDRREKPTTVIRPFFSLMAATAQEYVEDLLGNLEVAGGTLNRFLIVSGEEQAPKADVEPPSREAWERIAAPLRTVRDRRKAISTRMVWSTEAKELWGEFYVQWKMLRKGWSAKAANLTARTHEHVQKIALVYSALSGEREISARSLATAIAIGEWLEKTSLRLFGDVGLDPFAKAEKTVLEILKPKRRMWRRDLQQAASKKKINGKVFGEVLRTLEANGHVKPGESASLSGQRRPFVEYIPGNREHLSSSGTREKVLGVPDISPGGEL